MQGQAISVAFQAMRLLSVVPSAASPSCSMMNTIAKTMMLQKLFFGFLKTWDEAKVFVPW